MLRSCHSPCSVALATAKSPPGQGEPLLYKILVHIGSPRDLCPEILSMSLSLHRRASPCIYLLFLNYLRHFRYIRRHPTPVQTCIFPRPPPVPTLFPKAVQPEEVGFILRLEKVSTDCCALSRSDGNRYSFTPPNDAKDCQLPLVHFFRFHLAVPHLATSETDDV